MLKKAWEAG